MTNPNRFYVYAYLRVDGTPYYIGKGCGRRMGDARRHNVKVPPVDRQLMLLWAVSESEAFKYERHLISFYGLKRDGTGILRNLTDGGEGVSGYKHTDEAKAKMAERVQTAESNAARREKLLGKPLAPERAAKHAARMKETGASRTVVSSRNRAYNKGVSMGLDGDWYCSLQPKDQSRARRYNRRDGLFGENLVARMYEPKLPLSLCNGKKGKRHSDWLNERRGIAA